MAARSKEVAKLQNAELDRDIFDVGQSFHGEFQNCPWIIVRNLSCNLSEGDLATMFEQYGTLTALELMRDKDIGLSRGTAIMGYEDPRSAILAVDNFNAVTLLERQIAVDHVDFKPGDDARMTDSRTKMPTRLWTDKFAAAKPVCDEGFASSTDDEPE
jgi:RNA-binding motif X-linked protein 2